MAYGSYFNSITLANSEEKRLTLTFALFFCSDPVEKICDAVFSIVGLPGSSIAALLIVYAPLLSVLIRRFKAKDEVPLTAFPLVWFVLMGFFVVTLCIHPEYAQKAFQEGWQYNYLTSVVFPLSGVYAFGVILAMRNPRLIEKALWYAALLTFLYGLVRYGAAQHRGYWDAYVQTGAMIKSKYSLGFGYDMLFAAVVFMYFCFKREMRALNAALLALSVFMILTAGNRVPVLVLLVSLIVLGLLHCQQNGRLRPSYLILAIVTLLLLLVVGFFFNSIISWLSGVISSAGFNSRTLDALLDGSISDDNGRSSIHAAANALIESGGFFGYGLYGDRYYLGQQIFWGYPHNIILEFELTFGLIPGLALFLLLVWYVAHAFRNAAVEEWKMLIVLFSLLNIQLWFSLSYLYSLPFWSLLALCFLANRRRRVNLSLEKHV